MDIDTSSDVLMILGSSEEPVMSAQQIADQTNVSRQRVHSMLQSMEGEMVERVKVGPAVGWYIRGYRDASLESMFEEHGLASTGFVPCPECHEVIDDGERVAVSFERHHGAYEWDVRETICYEHIEDEVEFLESFPHGYIGAEQVRDYDMSHAVVTGWVEMREVERENGQVVETPVITDVTLRELLRAEDNSF